MARHNTTRNNADPRGKVGCRKAIVEKSFFSKLRDDVSKGQMREIEVKEGTFLTMGKLISFSRQNGYGFKVDGNKIRIMRMLTAATFFAKLKDKLLTGPQTITPNGPITMEKVIEFARKNGYGYKVDGGDITVMRVGLMAVAA